MYRIVDKKVLSPTVDFAFMLLTTSVLAEALNSISSVALKIYYQWRGFVSYISY